MVPTGMEDLSKYTDTLLVAFEKIISVSTNLALQKKAVPNSEAIDVISHRNLNHTPSPPKKHKLPRMVLPGCSLAIP